jgi:NAD(P)-dependent dehydrogenase (short-subunit alcohol dehydrogenase family)
MRAVMRRELAVVTGSASGIGAASARRLADDLGFDVVGVDLADSATRLSVTGDVGDPGTWSEVERLLADDGRPVAAVVTAAAVALTGTVTGMPLESFHRTIDVNLFGTLYALRTCLPSMIAARCGSIVTIASVDALFAERETAAYSASKGAVLQLTKAVALDHAPDGVRANCVCPGVTDTPFFRRNLPADGEQETVDRRSARNPIGRLLDADEVAAMVAFLTTPAASGITGACLTVDGGLTAGYEYPRAQTADQA